MISIAKLFMAWECFPLFQGRDREPTHTFNPELEPATGIWIPNYLIARAYLAVLFI